MIQKRFVVCSAALAAALAGAVISLGAQGPSTRLEPAPRGDRGLRVMTLDSRGSQLGVMVRDLEGEAAKTPGVAIDEVTPGSAADKAGLKAGDVVTEYDGERVRSARQFTRLVQETPEGRSVKIAIQRNGQRQTLEATPTTGDTGWSVSVDRDRIVREGERGVREGLREFRMDPPAFDFHFDGGMGGMMMTPRGRLGVSVESLSPQLAAYFGVKDGGALVSTVSQDSVAEKAGIKAGDVITSINHTRVRDANDLVREMANASGEVTVGLLRDKKETSVKATVDSRTTRPRAPRRAVQPATYSRPA